MGVGAGVGESVGELVGNAVAVEEPVAVASASGWGVSVLVAVWVGVEGTAWAVWVGVEGATWAVRVAATRVATRISRVEVAACVGAGGGLIVSVGVDDSLQLARSRVKSIKKQILGFIHFSIQYHLSQGK
jgi:hypothetical protein